MEVDCTVQVKTEVKKEQEEGGEEQVGGELVKGETGREAARARAAETGYVGVEEGGEQREQVALPRESGPLDSGRLSESTESSSTV